MLNTIKGVLLDAKYEPKANVHKHFLVFEKSISIIPSKKKILVKSLLALQKKINNYFLKKEGLNQFRTEIQGSFKMGTIVLGKNGTYDMDSGLYFIKKPFLTPITIKNHVYNAVKNHTSGGAIKKDKCIRVIYSGDYNVDLPVYYKNRNDKYPFLATKKDWLPSDPQGFCNWFKLKKQGNSQLVRLVKYFKYWSNTKNRKMPSGMALTVWISENQVVNDRDDIAFYETAKAIRKSLLFNIKCQNPSFPYDDLIKKLTEIQKNNFLKSLDLLLIEAKKALEQKKEERAIEFWRKILGSKFCGLF